MKKQSNKKHFLLTLSIITFSIATIGSTFAFLNTYIRGLDTSTPVQVKSANVLAVYEQHSNIEATDVTPGWSGEMEFSLINQSEEEGSAGYYELNWEITKNELQDNELRYSLTATSTRNGNNVAIGDLNKIVTKTNQPVPTVSSSVGLGLINTGVTHKYTLTLSFVDTEGNQNYNQGKTFIGKIIASEVSSDVIID